MVGHVVDALADGVKKLFILACCMLPFAVWKLVDIAIWLYRNVDVNVDVMF